MTLLGPLLDLTGVARLADVRRPVASMWRARFASTDDPFPDPALHKSGRPFFDAVDVATWLTRTRHGNNPQALADAAAAAAPPDFDIAEATHVDAIDALLTLHAATDSPVGDLDDVDLRRAAEHVDPEDACLVAELSHARPTWRTWADLLADAAYSPLEAARTLERRHAAAQSAAGRAGPLTPDAEALLAEMTRALLVGQATTLVLCGGVSTALAADLAARSDEELVVAVPPHPDARRIRRRLLCESIPAPAVKLVAGGSVRSARLIPGLDGASEVLHRLDELVLGMHDHDRAVVIAPDAALVAAVDATAAMTRSDALRTGRVRAVVRLPVGLVVSAPRERLALWVLGRETGDLPIVDRFTATADLSDVVLTPATRADLVSDVLAAMGGVREVRGHAFRFATIVPTRSLLASTGALVSSASARTRLSGRNRRDLPALLDRSRLMLGPDAPRAVPTPERSKALDPLTVADLIAQRHLRVLSGTRLDAAEYAVSGLTVVCADDLDDPSRIGGRRIDALSFAAMHPSAHLTAPGDVVFRTGPTAAAWVDANGSKVVAHPARVLRIDAADPGGLVAELIAADVDAAIPGPSAWRRWLLRRVAPSVIGDLRDAVREVEERRSDLVRRAHALDDYRRLLLDAVAAGAVTLSEPTTDSVSDPS